MDIKNIMWVEKYRPLLLKDVIGQNMTFIEEQLKNPMEMQNYLFVSRSPGTGKTSVAKCIKNELGLTSMDFLNCNSSDDRKLEFIRETIVRFAGTKRSNKNKPKIVLLDEVDGLLAASQDAMRGITEKFAGNCRFIATANNIEKLTDAFKSRFQIINFADISKEDILKRLQYICEKESVTYDNVGLNKIINSYYPDMRSMIQELQKLKNGGITEENVKTLTEQHKLIYKILCQKTAKEAFHTMITQNINMLDFMDFLYHRINEMEDSQKRTQGIFAIAEIDFRIATGAYKDRQTNAMLERYKVIFG